MVFKSYIKSINGFDNIWLADRLFKMREKKELIIGLGSNLGDRKQNLEIAILELEEVFKIKAKISPFYQSESWGFDTNELFLNCCIIISSDLSPKEILKQTQSIELKLGRVKKSKNFNYESRVIDIDILYFGDVVLKSENLTIPHPLIYTRSFVLKPLADVCPRFVDPLNGCSIGQLLAVCNDESKVILYED